MYGTEEEYKPIIRNKAVQPSASKSPVRTELIRTADKLVSPSASSSMPLYAQHMMSMLKDGAVGIETRSGTGKPALNDHRKVTLHDAAVGENYTNITETGRGPQGSSIAAPGGSASNDSVSKHGIQMQNYDDLNSKKMTLNVVHSHRSDPSKADSRANFHQQPSQPILMRVEQHERSGNKDSVHVPGALAQYSKQSGELSKMLKESGNETHKTTTRVVSRLHCSTSVVNKTNKANTQKLELADEAGRNMGPGSDGAFDQTLHKDQEKSDQYIP